MRRSRYRAELRWIGMSNEERRLIWIIMAFALLALASCGGDGPTGPSSVQPPAVSTRHELPPRLYGAFTSSADVLELNGHAGSVVLIVPSYQDDAVTIGNALRASGKTAIVSAHHCFGSPRSVWDSCWAQTKAWMEPFADRVGAIYVVDEPLHNGIPAADRDEAIARVRSEGYPTIVAEWVDQALRSSRAPSDLYGVTCYMWPGPGSWSMARCEEAYRSHPGWDLVIGQAFDMYEGAGNGPAGEQIKRWSALGSARRGVIFWVARWPGQIGLLDDYQLLRAYDEAAR